MDRKIHGIIRAYRNLPRALVEVYRAVPADVDGEILPGDWVTPVRGICRECTARGGSREAKS